MTRITLHHIMMSCGHWKAKCEIDVHTTPDIPLFVNIWIIYVLYLTISSLLLRYTTSFLLSWGRLSLLVAFLALLGLGVAQIVSTSSNLYLLSDAIPKRTYSLITGAVFSLTAFVPNFRDYRLLSFIGICSTFCEYISRVRSFCCVLKWYLTHILFHFIDSAWYIVIASATRGPDENVQYGAPWVVSC